MLLKIMASLSLHHQCTHIKLLKPNLEMDASSRPSFLWPTTLLIGLHYLRHCYQMWYPQSFVEKGYYFPTLGSNVSLHAALKITACLGTVLHCVCNSNLSSVFSYLSPLVILISGAILFIDFRLFSRGLFLFVLFNICGVLQILTFAFLCTYFKRSLTTSLNYLFAFYKYRWTRERKIKQTSLEGMNFEDKQA